MPILNKSIVLLIFISSLLFSSVIKQPLDTDKYYYALGQGETQKESRENALAFISEKISVSIASSFTLSSSVTQQDEHTMLLSDSKNDISSKSDTIKYTHVKTLETQEKDGIHSTLVRVDRAILFSSYKEKLDLINKDLRETYQLYLTQDKFERLKSSLSIKNNIKNAQVLLPILHAININYSSKKLLENFGIYEKTVQFDYNSLVFNIKYDKNSSNLASLLEEKLGELGISSNLNNFTYIIDLTTKAKKRKYKSTNKKFSQLTFALRLTTINIKDKEGNLLNKNIHKTKEASSEGFKDAILKNKKYNQMIEKVGVVSFLIN